MTQLPPQLYRYRAINDRLRQTVLDHKIYFCSPQSLNDPFECRFSTSVEGSEEQRRLYFRKWLNDRKVREAIVAMSVEDGDFDALRAFAAGEDAYIAYLARSPLYATPLLAGLLEAELKTTISHNIGVCCFSEVPGDPVMFSHYAAGHEGCCLEFSTADTLLGQAFPIVYSDEPPTLDIFEPNPARFAQITLGTKQSRWSYEREWRAIVYPMGASLQSIAPTTLTGVILGYKCPPEREAALKALLAERGAPHVELSKLFLESNRYSFQRRTLPRAT